MRKTFFFLFFAIVFCVEMLGQSKPLLLGKFDAKTEDPDALYHKIEEIRDKFKEDSDAQIAFRVCASEPLPVAFAKAAGVEWGTSAVKRQLDFLKDNYNVEISDSSLIFLKNSNCKPAGNPIATEFWFVPSAAEFPAFVEMKKLGDLKKRVLTFDFNKVNEALPGFPLREDGTKLTLEAYEAVKNETLQTLKKEKAAFLLITTPAYGRAAKNLAGKALAFKQFLNRKGIGSHRIFIEKRRRADVSENFYPDTAIIYQK